MALISSPLCCDPRGLSSAYRTSYMHLTARDKGRRRDGGDKRSPPLEITESYESGQTSFLDMLVVKTSAGDSKKHHGEKCSSRGKVQDRCLLCQPEVKMLLKLSKSGAQNAID